MDQTEKFLRKVNMAFQEGDSEFLLNSVTDDFCWNIVGQKLVGGKSEFSEAIEQMHATPTMKIQVKNVIINNKDAIVEGIVIARNRKDQKKYFSFCDVFTLTNTSEPKIRKMRSYVIDVSKHKQYRENPDY
ncbi:nuclear transport factor 2 family protein [Salinimicrobium catena]